MKVVANHLCPCCGSFYRKQTFKEIEGKMKKVVWCSNPHCEEQNVRVLAGLIKYIDGVVK